jgi:hypothetical protein
MNCENARLLLTDAAANAVAAPLRDVLDAHLRECAACQREAETLRVLWAALGDVPAETVDSAAMRQRFDHMLEGYVAGASASPARGASWNTLRGTLQWLWTPGLRPAWAAALAVVTFGAGLGVGRQAAAPEPAAVPEVAALRAEVGDLRQMVSLSLLRQQSASDRLKGVSWAADLEPADPAVVDALLSALTRDPNVNVRLASVDALRRFATRDAVRQGALEALQRQASPLVQLALIDFVVDARLMGADDALRRLADTPDTHEAVRARAERGLEQIAS